MSSLGILVSFVLIFALPAGVLLGLTAKRQKDAGLLRLAVPDRSLFVKVLPLLVAGLLLGLRGKLQPVSPLQIVLVFTFFAAAALIAFATYRLAVRRSSEG